MFPPIFLIDYSFVISLHTFVLWKKGRSFHRWRNVGLGCPPAGGNFAPPLGHLVSHPELLSAIIFVCDLFCSVGSAGPFVTPLAFTLENLEIWVLFIVLRLIKSCLEIRNWLFSMSRNLDNLETNVSSRKIPSANKAIISRIFMLKFGFWKKIFALKIFDVFISTGFFSWGLNQSTMTV